MKSSKGIAFCNSFAMPSQLSTLRLRPRSSEHFRYVVLCGESVNKSNLKTFKFNELRLSTWARPESALLCSEIICDKFNRKQTTLSSWKRRLRLSSYLDCWGAKTGWTIEAVERPRLSTIDQWRPSNDQRKWSRIDSWPSTISLLFGIGLHLKIAQWICAYLLIRNWTFTNERLSDALTAMSLQTLQFASCLEVGQSHFVEVAKSLSLPGLIVCQCDYKVRCDFMRSNCLQRSNCPVRDCS